MHLSPRIHAKYITRSTHFALFQAFQASLSPSRKRSGASSSATFAIALTNQIRFCVPSQDTTVLCVTSRCGHVSQNERIHYTTLGLDRNPCRYPVLCHCERKVSRGVPNSLKNNAHCFFFRTEVSLKQRKTHVFRHTPSLMSISSAHCTRMITVLTLFSTRTDLNRQNQIAIDPNTCPSLTERLLPTFH